MMTPWGYEIDGESIPPLLSVEAFNTMTGGKYTGNDHVGPALMAASQAVRNACGWHVSPQFQCTASPIPSGSVVKLPANLVTSIVSITESGDEIDDYEWLKNGLVRRSRWSGRWGAIEVEYTAGYESAAVPDLAEAVRSIAEGVLAVSAGVVSESADGVSISYSASASSIAAALTSQQRDALAPYRLVSSHAA